MAVSAIFGFGRNEKKPFGRTLPIAFPDDDDCSMFISNPAEKWQIEFSCLSVEMMHCGMQLLEER